jgi:transcriptional regulator with GAF, ATPase, and Fis domain
VRDMLPELAPVIDEVLKIARRPAPVQLAPDPAVEEVDEARLLGASRPMLKLLAEIGRLAQHDETVLILGETGTGKDLVARAIHTNSRRRNGPYLTMNCAALPETLLESELFGHEPGAFTSATKLRKGRFEHANGGTLFLDEVGDMPLSFQVKLLRVLENHEIVRVGGNDPIRIDVRILAATHRDLAALVREKAFREDLYYRLHVFPVRLPPLRERKGDIDLLGRVFLARMFPDRGARPVLHPDALRRLQDYDWPGNVRQLQKVLCRAAGSCRGRQIMPEDIDFGEIDRPESSNPQAALRTVVEAAWRDHPDHLWAHLEEQLQRQLLAYALEQPAASQSSIARRLGVSRGLVIKWLKQFGFNEPPDEADSASA